VPERYDYVIVGAGSAGCILANKLSADPGRRVLLIEAGPKGRAKEIRIPAAFSKLFKSKFDWGYETTPQDGLGGRRIYFPRGKTLGGSSAMNAQMHVPGHPDDFDAWPDGWSWETMKLYLETFEQESRSISESREPNPMTRAFLEAVERSGVAGGSDLSPESLEGAGLVRVQQRKGLRCTAADAWLKPAQGRENLEIRTDAQVVRVDFEGKRAAGVRYTGGHAEVAGELILSGGAIGSPQLLLLSGVGPADELRAQGTSPSTICPKWGGTCATTSWRSACGRRRSRTHCFAAEKPIQLVKLLLQRRGLLTSNVGEAAVFTKSRAGLTAPDLELIFAPVLYLEEGLTPPDAHGFSIAAVCLQPRSVGKLRLRSSDPLEHPDIDPAFAAEPEDLAVLTEGVKRMRRIVASAPLSDIAERERAPGDADVESWIRASAHTIYHPVGTCCLGTVVDDQLRVTGLEGIRVADASVIPNLMRGHSHAQASMLALRAAELIKRAAV
jgi:choline dehydrogenase